MACPHPRFTEGRGNQPPPSHPPGTQGRTQRPHTHNTCLPGDSPCPGVAAPGVPRTFNGEDFALRPPSFPGLAASSSHSEAWQKSVSCFHTQSKIHGHFLPGCCDVGGVSPCGIHQPMLLSGFNRTWPSAIFRSHQTLEPLHPSTHY